MARPALGQHLRSLRTSRGLKLREVEAASGISNAYVSQLETGKADQPSPHVLQGLAATYGVSYEDLMVRAGYLARVPGTRVTAAELRDLNPEEEQAVLDFIDYLRFRRGIAAGAARRAVPASAGPTGHPPDANTIDPMEAKVIALFEARPLTFDLEAPPD